MIFYLEGIPSISGRELRENKYSYDLNASIILEIKCFPHKIVNTNLQWSTLFLNFMQRHVVVDLFFIKIQFSDI